jgi:hypothetical protein
MENPKLLACPFCGSEVTLKDTGNDAGYRWLVRCDNALCMVNPFARAKSLDATMAIWNQRAGGRKPAPPETETVKALASATGSTAGYDWTVMCDKLPPHCVRVMTYSPQPIGARQNLTDGVAILCWNAHEQRWCDDNGETSMFKPTAWWPITIPTKKR